MALSADPTKGTAVFKKKPLRPWKQTSLGHSKKSAPDTERHAEISTEFLQTQLHTALTEKNKFEKELLSISDQHVTIGGFLKPTHILFSNPDALPEITATLDKLYKKEREILDITYKLKLMQAEERAERAETETVASIQKTHQLTEQLKIVEEQAYFAEQERVQLEQQLYKAEQMFFAKENQLDVKYDTDAAHWEQTKLTYESTISDKLAYIEKMNIVLASERALRQLYEQQAKETIAQILALEKQIAEEKAAHMLQQPISLEKLV